MATAPLSGDSIKTSGLTLPAYVLMRPEGVFINLSPPLNKIFSSCSLNACFPTRRALKNSTMPVLSACFTALFQR